MWQPLPENCVKVKFLACVPLAYINMACTHRTPHKHVVGYIDKYLIGGKQLMGLFQFQHV